MDKRTIRAILTCAASFLLCGCTYQAWYEGFKESARQKYYEQIGQHAIQQCLDEVNSQT